MTTAEWALLVAVLTFLSGALGVYLVNRRAKASQKTAVESKKIAEESVRVAREALEDTRKAKRDALWSAAIEQVHTMIGFDPYRQEVHPRFLALRVSTDELVDGLTDWEGLKELGRAQRVDSAAPRPRGGSGRGGDAESAAKRERGRSRRSSEAFLGLGD